jgi:pyrroline-5-carboxylate reductase
MDRLTEHRNHGRELRLQAESSIGFIGAGNMAASLIHGLINRGQTPNTLFAADIDQDKLDSLAQSTGIQATTPQTIAERADVIVLAVKPQVMSAVCSELGALAGDRSRPALFISVAAGTPLASLESWLGGTPAVVRCMPNTPALVGRGATGLFANTRVSAAQRDLAQTLLAAVGVSVWVDSEADLDTVTAVSGSGPAYFFLFMEAMQEAAMEMGLSAELARLLVTETAAGAAELAAQSDDDAGELRRKVTSPGGTTEQAIQQFEAGQLRALVKRAMAAARQRSVELARPADK